jgi:hypothetical protein
MFRLAAYLSVCVVLLSGATPVIFWRGTVPIQSISPDASRVSFIDPLTQELGTLAVVTGKRKIIQRPSSKMRVFLASAVARNGDVAFGFRAEDDAGEIQITQRPKYAPRVVYRDIGFPVIWVMAWSSDDQALLAYMENGKQQGFASKTSLISRDGKVLWSLDNFDFDGPVLLAEDGKSLIYSRRANRSARQRDIYSRSVENHRETMLVSTMDDEYAVGRLGKRLLFIRPNGRLSSLYVCSLDGTEVTSPELVARGLRIDETLGVTTGGVYRFLTRPTDLQVYKADLGPDGKVTSRPEVFAKQEGREKFYPRWSADGKRLAYAGRPAGAGYGTLRIFVRDAATGEEKIFPPTIQMSDGISWTRDGGLICIGARQRRGPIEFFRINPLTGVFSPIESAGQLPATAFGLIGIPQVSPDDKTVFYRDDQRHGVFARNLMDGSERVLYQAKSPYPELRVVHPSPDGKLVAFGTSINGAATLFVVPVDGGTPREVLTISRPETGFLRHPGIAWSADSRSILFVRGVGPELHLWSVPASGGKARPIGISMEGLRHPHVHPDGKSLVFAAGLEDVNEIWGVQIPGAQ